MADEHEHEQDMLIVENFIRGNFISNAECGLEYIESYEPATGLVWARIPDSGEDEVGKAVQAAKIAFPRWVLAVDWLIDWLFGRLIDWLISLA